MNVAISEKLDKSIVLIGLMGAGKSSIGRRLAKHLGLAFRDTDDEIVKAAGCSIEEIFTQYGETAFRDCERKVIDRLLKSEPLVLATGGGAFMDERTRETICKNGISVWLRADLDTLHERTSRRGGRPLLENDDPRGTLEKLMNERYPVYAQADLTIDSDDQPHEIAVKNIADALQTYLKDRT